jgi:hypothetical protein
MRRQIVLIVAEEALAEALTEALLCGGFLVSKADNEISVGTLRAGIKFDKYIIDDRSALSTAMRQSFPPERTLVMTTQHEPIWPTQAIRVIRKPFSLDTLLKNLLTD